MASAENSKKTAKRGTPASFKPGQSGNPGGRPKKTPEELDLVAACKAKSPEALEVMVHMMHSAEQEKTRLTAAMAIIERGYGKPVQPTDTHVSGEIALLPKRPKLSREEWLASLAK